MVIGFIAGLMVGALAAVANASTGYIIVAALGLGIPLAIFGMIYDALLDAGKLNFGYAAPTALYGVLTFPLARLVQEGSEEHTSELQSRQYLVCRLLLEKKKNKK